MLLGISLFPLKLPLSPTWFLTCIALTMLWVLPGALTEFLLWHVGMQLGGGAGPQSAAARARWLPALERSGR